MRLDRSKVSWQASVCDGDSVNDATSPTDIGCVYGAVLVNPPPNSGIRGKVIIYAFGPRLLTNDQQREIVKKVTGKDIDVKHCPNRDIRTI